MAFKRSRQAFEADLQIQESPYVFYGTPLPPLHEQVRDDGSFVPVWKQEVLDDRGRKRLHGAFTGGFSAGYYNTVGSKEGWAPSTFLSSRQNRVKDAKSGKQQRPEDFMDEEDLREADEARQLQTAEAFSGFGTEHDEGHKGVIMDIFHPTSDTAGIKLLKRMGWKEGQGIGPKVKRPAILGDDNQQSQEIHAFAPDDVPIISFIQKHDRKGLGYEGEEDFQNRTQKLSASAGRKTASNESDEEHDQSTNSVLGPRTAKSLKKKGAFGFGVLNDTGSDDDNDPYSMGPRISYNKTIGGDKKPKKKPPVLTSTANPSLKTKPVFLSKKLASIQGALRKCHDGRLPLDGFFIGDDLDGMAFLSLKHDRYKPPPVPLDWKSSFAANGEAQPSNTFTSVSDAAKISTLTSNSRASILGESSLPGKSVFDFLTPSTRDRLAAASGKTNLPPGLGEKPLISAQPNEPNMADLIPKLDQDVALQALSRAQSGWMPYSDDKAKQSRYKKYLEIRAGMHPTESGDEIPPRPPPMSQNDWVIELQEFARAAEVFRPVTGLMASRFTSSTTTLPQSSDTGDSANAPDDLLTKPQAKRLDPGEEAARMGMFGHMTRSTINFYPTRLLCKRFGVPMPVHGHGHEQTDRGASDAAPSSSAGATAWPTAMQTMPSDFNAGGRSRFEPAGSQTMTTADNGKPAISAPSHGQLGPEQPDKIPVTATATATAAVSATAIIDTDRNEALEQEKPGAALFKAIFGSDDEDDDD